MGQGPSTASQTAWAVSGADRRRRGPIPGSQGRRGVSGRTQNSQGRWDEEHFTGTGFPGHFMIRYHLYRDCFPLQALGQYLKEIKVLAEE